MQDLVQTDGQNKYRIDAHLKGESSPKILDLSWIGSEKIMKIISLEGFPKIKNG